MQAPVVWATVHGEVMVSRQPLPNDAHRASCPDLPGSFIYSNISDHNILFNSHFIAGLSHSCAIKSAKVQSLLKVQRLQQRGTRENSQESECGFLEDAEAKAVAGGFYLPPSWILCASASCFVEISCGGWQSGSRH